jgi:hypothetical protein
MVQYHLCGLFLLAVMASGCENDPDAVRKREALRAEMHEQSKLKEEARAKICRVGVKLSQSRVSLDLFAHMKDAMNEVQFDLPTACENVEKIAPGTQLADAFRAGSLIFDGSLSSWDARIATVLPIHPDANKGVCRVVLELKQARISLDLGQHIKDAINATRFEWDIPSDVYDGSNIGHNFIKDGLRVGSLVIGGTLSDWQLNIKEKKGCAPTGTS